jgi:2-hydroxy-3-keto-5-methylthiopentenyl-1-phosphate phosphatase
MEIRQYANLPDGERPIMFYAGDGVSDLSAAKETDLLFAKKGHGKSSRKDEMEKMILTALQISSHTVYVKMFRSQFSRTGHRFWPL